MYFLRIFKAEKLQRREFILKWLLASAWTEIAWVSSTCAKESAIWGSDNLLTG